MKKRIIYQNDAGGVAILIPSPSSKLTIEQIAAKDVPPKSVFVQTGQETLTQEAYDADPGYWDGDYEVGDTYPVGHWEDRPRRYKIVDASDVPSDRSARNSWTVDEADLTDGVGA